MKSEIKREYRVCTRCIMDNASDPGITFNEKGQCNYCTTALKQLETSYFPNEEGAKRLERLLTELKTNGKGKKYDCLMGISGGLDSAYLAYLGARK
ncbi:MAG: hypothetical protein LIP00_01210 [Parabacteroides sp.]|nr:hypothetical protein [Parabacteroides sp.]